MNTNDLSKKELLDLFEVFTTRIDMLSLEQRTLVRLFQTTPNYRFLAKMANVNEATVARRLKKIAWLISSGNFAAVLSRNNDVPPEKMEAIRNYFLNRLSSRAISENTGLSIYRIKKIIRQMRNL
ncbi:MAG: hypothetical protein ABSE89_07185 [Sedimentisphaerales bacterium]